MPALGSMTTAIRNEILRTLQQDVTWAIQPGDQPVTIQPNAIVFQKARAQLGRPGQREKQNIDMPGLLVSKPSRTSVNPNEWTNEADLWRRYFLIQIVDHDEYSNTDRQDTWDKWAEQIIAAFMFNPLPKTIFPYTPTWVLATATGVQDIDEKHWTRDDNFIEGVEIEVRIAPGAANSRGIIA